MSTSDIRALQPTEVIMALGQISGWRLSGDGDHVAIEKTFEFAQHAHALLFVNSVGWLSERLNHHPRIGADLPTLCGALEHTRCAWPQPFGL